MSYIGLVGHHLSHSFSKQYHEKIIREKNLDIDFINIDLDNIEEFPDFLKKHPNSRGLFVTSPYKEVIINYLDEIDDIAKEIGAVNLIEINKGRLIGHNSDIIGFEHLLNNAILGTRISNSLVLGSGGASKAVQYVLKQKNIPFDIASRHPNGNQKSYEDIEKEGLANYRLIVNATPLGMWPDTGRCAPLPYGTIAPNTIAIDLIYNPEETLFLKKAKAQNALTFNGMEMLVKQANAAWQGILV